MKFVKIYGERNTGTTYLTRLISRNIVCKVVKSRPPFWLRKIQKLIPNNNEILRDLYFSIRKNNLGWKHAFVNEKLFEPIQRNQNDFLILTLTKNPYSWLLSMYRKPYHSRNIRSIEAQSTSFEDFLKKEWRSVQRENYPKKIIQNPIILWNIKNAAYLTMMKEKKYQVINLKYESILRNYAEVLEKITNIGVLRLKNKKVSNIVNSVKGHAKTFYDYQDYYLNEDWKEKLNKTHIDFINHHLDSDLMKTFNYNIINK